MRFETKTLGEVIDTFIDYRGKTPKKTKSGIPLITAKIVKNGFIEKPTEFISEDNYDAWMKRGIPCYGDVVLTTEAPLGQVAQIKTNKKIALAQRIITLRGRSGVLDNSYLKYYLQSTKGQAELRSRSTGSTVSGIKNSELRKIQISFPSFALQKKIASILSSLDDKIELNNKINYNLQEQARSLFKAWFVDYIPFGGSKPANWKAGKLKDILLLKRNAIKPGENTELNYLPIDAIPMNTFAVSEVRPNNEAQSSLITFNRDDIIIGAMRIYFHRVIIAPFDGITRTTCFTLCSRSKEYLAFNLLCCDQDSTIEYAQATSRGSTMPYAVWDGGLGEMMIEIPDKAIALEFNEIVLPIIRTIQSSFLENKRLQELRDGLLPRLITGELDVSGLEL